MSIYLSKNIDGIKPLANEFDIQIVGGKKDIKTVGVLNLMPTKCETETQILRLLCETEKDLNVEFIKLDSYKPKNIPYEYLQENYKVFNDVKNNIDILIITGAPLEKLEFEDVDYIEELREVLDYTKNNIRKSLYICWGAQVALNHFYSIRKKILNEKIFGVFSHEIINEDKILDGISSGFKAPHSRYTSLENEDIERCKTLKTLVKSENGYRHLLKGEFNDYYILGHIEYDEDTLKKEYLRDKNKGLEIDKPAHYFKNDKVEEGINFNWREDAIKFYKNLVS